MALTFSGSDTLFNNIRQLIERARTQVQRAINSAMVQTYWQIGRLIVEEEQQGKARAAYGRQQLARLADRLTEEFGKGFDISNLRRMRKFYTAFPIQGALRPELSWTHYRHLMRVANDRAREWYANEAIEQNWSARALDRQIGVLYYERLLSSKNQQSVRAEAQEKTQVMASSAEDYLRDPYLLDFLNLSSEGYQETDLEQGLIDNLKGFLLELGKGFAFVARQQRIQTEDQDFYVDLVFYNFKLQRFLLVDLKIGKLTHQDIGQMDSYVRIYDQHKKSKNDNPTIGLVLCSEKSATMVKYSMLADSEQLFAAKYPPTEEELKAQIERERSLMQNRVEVTAC
ncbi:MAG: hypothetical protein CMF39_02415 [Legionellaceae bacterium]|nr:hypothetical protein [Legionellaceae bacterium]